MKGREVPDTAPARLCSRRPDRDPLVLQGSGGVIWALAADGVADVPTALAAAVGSPVDEIRKQVTSFLADLVTRGLLAVDLQAAQK